MNTYQVAVKTTNACQDTTYGPGKGKIGNDPYRDCEHGFLYVVTNDPKKIYDEFPDVIAVTRIGVGYHL